MNPLRYNPCSTGVTGIPKHTGLPAFNAAGAFEDTKAVVYDFCDSRAGENAKVFLGDWRGNLVCDDFSGYKQLMTQGVTEVGCLAHARRKFFDLHASNKSQIAQSALEQIARIYDIEREIKEITADERQRIRQEKSKPLLDALLQWMILNRQKITDGSATARALDYSRATLETVRAYVQSQGTEEHAQKKSKTLARPHPGCA
jgi:transposase